ncbi:family 16 glycosylhydrolase [Mucilaginibacter angelicae]|uniref:Family 16 glycosylhydrolase n=1 Tax=Mucilaginibacter angelicae TaxID=869718 RepID=A0ABV6LFG6_9SPHI
MNFKKHRYNGVIWLACGIVLLSACSSTKKTAASNIKGKVVFFDDFNRDQIDRSKWNFEITGMHFNDELQAYVDTPSTAFIVHGANAEGANGGALEIRPKSAPGFVTKDGQHFDFISSRLTTQNKFQFTYGTAEARIKLTDGAGLWPAWWLLGTGEWPKTGETDIMEYIGEKDWVSAAVHGPGYSGETPFVNRQYFDADKDVTHWHTYAVDWTPDELDFKYDGKLMFRVTKTMAQHYGKWAFDNQQYLILNFALGGGYPVKINGVKQPYGLPQSSVELVKSGQVKMLVDWVRVTQR